MKGKVDENFTNLNYKEIHEKNGGIVSQKWGGKGGKKRMFKRTWSSLLMV